MPWTRSLQVFHGLAAFGVVAAKVRADLLARVLRRSDAIAAARLPQSLNVPGFEFHSLQGSPKRYSIHVNGPWCLTFGWDGEDAVELDLENYH